MIGILDSGEGGMNAARYLEKSTDESIIFFPDRKNAPYGTKTREELIALTEAGIGRLTDAGADRVLIACCTAGTVFSELKKEYREISFPLISPTARTALKATKTGRIALIATNATVSSGAFEEEIKKQTSSLGKSCSLLSIRAQSLVEIVEREARGEDKSPEKSEIIREVLRDIKGSGADTLILGCTHFPSLEEDIKMIVGELGVRTLISSVKEGVKAFLKENPPKERQKRKIFLSLRG